MIKAIENQKIYHREVFHLRFFRIVFNTGKFAIKLDKGDKKMRSFDLSNLLTVEASDAVVAAFTRPRSVGNPREK